MIQIFRKIRGVLDARERRNALMLLCLMLVAAFVEVVGVASVMPFVAILADPTIVSANRHLNWAFTTMGFTDPRSFMVLLGLVTVLVFLGALTIKAVTTYSILRFSNMRAHSISTRLLTGYLSQPYVFYLGRNTAELSKTLFSEVGEVTNGVLIPALKLISNTIVALFIAILLLVVDPLLTVIIGAVLGGSFTLIYVLSRRTLRRFGEQRVQDNTARFVLASEAMNGIKDLRLLGRERYYLDRFRKVSHRFCRQAAISKAIGDIPHLAIQGVAFGGVLLLVLYLTARHNGLSGAMPIIVLYAFAGYRMLPAFQEIFKNSTQMRYYSPALDRLHADLELTGTGTLESSETAPVRLEGAIEVKDVSFAYPGTNRPTIKGVSLTIPKGSSAAFIGRTGAGKSTIVDLITGLLEPQKGFIAIGGTPLTPDNLCGWQRTIGYVPQTIFLTDASIAENIAFGIPPQEIDLQAVQRAAKSAHIHDFIASGLPDGYQTLVGERGIRLSGGQRQRIGIARALYHNPQVVVFDEATSALDNSTEEAVIEAINDLVGEKTVILIAHRLTTVQRCDTIYLLAEGSIRAAGTYEDLLDNEDFQRLSSLKPTRRNDHA